MVSLPRVKNCASGKASLTIDLPQNASPNAVAVVFTLSVTGPNLLHTSSTTSVYERAATSRHKPPVVTLQPASRATTAGQTVTFTAAASGNPTPTVQWQLSADGGRTWQNAPGTTSKSTSYSFVALASENRYDYRARFTNAAGSALTTAATLTIPTITQDSPTTGTTVAGSSLTDYLVVSGSAGTLTFTVTSPSPAFSVSSSGVVSAPATLGTGSYTVSGTDTDTFGDNGTWSYKLTVTARDGTITQDSPTTGTTVAGSSLTDYLVVSGSAGTLTFTVTSPSPAFSVSSSGVVSAPATLGTGSYTVSGTDTDTFGDNGTWSYKLTVTARDGTITQDSPTTGTTVAGSSLTDYLVVSGSAGTLTFTVTSPSPAFSVSSSGVVSAPATLGTGSYTVSGTDTDTFGDNGTWSYKLTVTARDGTITQDSPTTGTTVAGSSLTDYLVVSGSAGTLTFTVTSPSPAFSVSSSGVVSAPATLGTGSYTVSGTDTDTFGDNGTWSYKLTVTARDGTITQDSPTTGTTVAGSSLTDYLVVSGSAGTLTFTVTSPSPAFSVSSSGVVSAPATLGTGSYTVSGTDTDTFGDNGTWSYKLTVTARDGTITQDSPTTGTTVAGSSLTDYLVVSGSAGTLTFTVTSPSPAFSVSSSGVVSAPATLGTGSYTVSGTDTDTFGDNGTWSYKLTVNPAVAPVVTGQPASDTVTAGGTAAFTASA